MCGASAGARQTRQGQRRCGAEAERFEAHALRPSLRSRPRCDGTSSRPYCPAPSFPSRLCGFVFPLVALPKARVTSLTTCPLVREEVFSFVTNFFFLKHIVAGNPGMWAAMGPGLGWPHTLHASPHGGLFLCHFCTGPGRSVTEPHGRAEERGFRGWPLEASSCVLVRRDLWPWLPQQLSSRRAPGGVSCVCVCVYPQRQRQPRLLSWDRPPSLQTKPRARTAVWGSLWDPGTLPLPPSWEAGDRCLVSTAC